MPYIIPKNRKFCLSCDIADVILLHQDIYPKEPYDEPHYDTVDKKYQTKLDAEAKFWLGCESTLGCSDQLRDTAPPYEAMLGIDKYYLRNPFKYPTNPSDGTQLQFSYKDNQLVEWKDIFMSQYHFTVNGNVEETWDAEFYKQTNKTAIPNKSFNVTSFKGMYRSTNYGLSPLRLMHKLG